MDELVDRLDDLQRRHRALGIPLAVIYKFFDDQGNYLAAIITYYTFVAIFPNPRRPQIMSTMPAAIETKTSIPCAPSNEPPLSAPYFDIRLAMSGMNAAVGP